jgi:hypothetical protein
MPGRRFKVTDTLEMAVGAFAFYIGSYVSFLLSVWTIGLVALVFAVLLTIAVIIKIFG